MYKVVGWRKEYYERCMREMDERQERLLRFLKEKFGIDREDVVRYNTSAPESVITNLEKYGYLKERKDIRIKVIKFYAFDPNRSEILIKPNRSTEEGRVLEKMWLRALTGNFGLVFHPTHPFFLRVSPWNCKPEDRPYISGEVRAIVKEINGELILVDWEGFDPEKLEGFERVEVKV